MDARTHIIALANECWVSRCLHAAAVFDLADHVGERGIHLNDLARKAKLDARILGSVVRVLGGRNIFKVEGDVVFHTESSALLKCGHPAMIGDIIKWSASEENWSALGRLPEVVKSGKSGFEAAFGTRFFDHLSQSDGVRDAFRRSMDGYTMKQVAGIIESTDLSRFGAIVDVGGGGGLLANAIAEHYPSKHVVLFDLPGVAPRPREGDLISIVEGNFFVDAIPPGDLVMLMNVLHDWNDEEACLILKNVRRAVAPNGQVYIVEGLMEPEKPAIDLIDLGMAVMTGGRQRSADDYEILLSRAGYSLAQQKSCTAHLSIIVCNVQDFS